jgi:hypothetical protein
VRVENGCFFATCRFVRFLEFQIIVSNEWFARINTPFAYLGNPLKAPLFQSVLPVTSGYAPKHALKSDMEFAPSDSQRNRELRVVHFSRV